MNKFILIVGALFVLGVSPVHAETLDNQSVMTLIQAGLGEASIVAKIKNTPSKFDLSTERLIELKKAGIPDVVLAAMLDASNKPQATQLAAMNNESPDPNVPHASGIYVLADWEATPKMVRMDATASNQAKTSNMFGYALTGGIASLKVKQVLPNEVARVKVGSRRPVFYFYFDQANAGLSGGAPGGFYFSGMGTPVTSPNEFTLVKFEVKGGARQATTGKINLGGGKSGVMDKARVSFDYSDVSTGVFKVTVDQGLEPGEYGFIYSASAGGGMLGGGQTSRVFDFSIR